MLKERFTALAETRLMENDSGKVPEVADELTALAAEALLARTIRPLATVACFWLA